MWIRPVCFSLFFVCTLSIGLFASHVDDSEIKSKAQSVECHSILIEIIRKACLDSDRALLAAVLEYKGTDNAFVSQLSSNQILDHRIAIRDALHSSDHLIRDHYNEPQSVKDLPRILQIFLDEGYNIDDHLGKGVIISAFMNISYYSDDIRQKLLQLVLASPVKNLAARKKNLEYASEYLSSKSKFLYASCERRKFEIYGSRIDRMTE